MGSLDTRAYRTLFAGGMGLRCAIGGTLARFFVAMTTLAFLAMYTQSGYSYALAGIGIGIVQLSNCLIAPQVSRLIDRRGQSRVVPVAGAIGMGSLAAVLAIVHFGGPLWAAFAVSALIGFTPQVQSLTRARWSYLFHRDRNLDAGLLKTAFSFEGILDDLAFMLAPALAIALSSWLFPEAGLILGGIAYVIGMAIVLSDRGSEPDPGFMNRARERGDAPGGRNVFASYPPVFVMFLGMFCMGLLFGFLDPATYGFCGEVAREEVASLVFMLSSIVSVVTGLVFGMVYVRAAPVRQVLAVGIACGVLYLPMAFVTSIPMLFVAHVAGAFCYAPFIITLNSIVERTVDGSRVTESLTWMNAGMQLGLAAGPIAGGALVDVLGTHAAFIGTTASALLIPTLFFAALPVLRRGLPRE